jgi:hypothetical protein
MQWYPALRVRPFEPSLMYVELTLWPSTDLGEIRDHSVLWHKHRDSSILQSQEAEPHSLDIPLLLSADFVVL